MMRALGQHPFDRERLQRCEFPVFLGYGELTGAHDETRACVLARLLPDVDIRRFGGIRHFVPPEEIYSPDHVAALQMLWARANHPVEV